MSVQIERRDVGISYDKAPVGTYLEIVGPKGNPLIGGLIFKPPVSGTLPCLLSDPLTGVIHTDRLEVVPLRTGDVITITVDYARWKEAV